MRRILCTFSGARYDRTTESLVKGSPRFGATEVLVFDDVWLRAHSFYETNRWIFEHRGQQMSDGSFCKRGLGWYSWKPLVLLEALNRCDAGDVVLYVDADTRPIADLSVIFETAARDGAMFFKAQGHSNHRWNKRDCLVVMGQDEDRYRFAPHVVARFVAIRKGHYRATQLLWEWLTYSVNPVATTFDSSILGPEHPEFEEHRTEQAILTNLVHKHGFRVFRECDDSGEGSNEDRERFGQLFVQDRVGDGSDPRGSRWRNA